MSELSGPLDGEAAALVRGSGIVPFFATHSRDAMVVAALVFSGVPLTWLGGFAVPPLGLVGVSLLCEQVS